MLGHLSPLYTGPHLYPTWSEIGHVTHVRACVIPGCRVEEVRTEFRYQGKRLKV